jgi:hypothetical protein
MSDCRQVNRSAQRAADKSGDGSRDTGDGAHATWDFLDVDARICRCDWHVWSSCLVVLSLTKPSARLSSTLDLGKMSGLNDETTALSSFRAFRPAEAQAAYALAGAKPDSDNKEIATPRQRFQAPSSCVLRYGPHGPDPPTATPADTRVTIPSSSLNWSQSERLMSLSSVPPLRKITPPVPNKWKTDATFG